MSGFQGGQTFQELRVAFVLPRQQRGQNLVFDYQFLPRRFARALIFFRAAITHPSTGKPVIVVRLSVKGVEPGTSSPGDHCGQGIGRAFTQRNLVRKKLGGSCDSKCRPPRKMGRGNDRGRGPGGGRGIPIERHGISELSRHRAKKEEQPDEKPTQTTGPIDKLESSR
jgi:hypothetical protein